MVESIACGLPVVGFKEIFEKSNFVINSQNAFLVDTDKQFKDAILTLLNDENLRIKMSRKSREIAEKELDFKVWHDELHANLYERLLSK